jgi:hypothetical protein
MKTRSKSKYSVQHSQSKQVDLQRVPRYPTPSQPSPKFDNYCFVADRSWLPKRWTFERAGRVMQSASSGIEQLPGMEYIWLDDLKDQHERVLPRHASPEWERTANSFLQYRILVQRAFVGKQTEISKEIESLWRAESKEMQFYCYRNAEIETCIPAEGEVTDNRPWRKPFCSCHRPKMFSTRACSRFSPPTRP